MNVTYRKLVRVGNSYYLAIPKSWLDSADVRPGELLVVRTNGNIIIERMSQPNEIREQVTDT